ncbi:MAG: amidohydrolase [Subtercola sp.]|nr:amidohydrolase [Subtercola sp.]
MSYLSEAETYTDDLIALRCTLHRDPEIGLELPHTRAHVLAALDGLPLELTLRDDDASIVAVLRGGTGGGSAAGSATGNPQPDGPRRSVLLRADMDALPVHELTELPYAAQGDAMHACGHDLHTAILVGAARVLSARRQSLAGDVVMLFQPGEEGFDGAKRMIAAGALDASGVRPSAAYALHVTSARYAGGVVATRPGAFMAASDVLRVTVRGRGGHASAPHETLDPITVAAELVTALQTLVTRRFDAFDPVVLTVGSFHAGVQHNIIPDTAQFEATVRTFSSAAQAGIAEKATLLCTKIAEGYGLTAEVEWTTLYPVTENDPAEARFLMETAGSLFGEANVTLMPAAIAGSEDFSRILQLIPGAMAFLGATPAGADPDTAAFNHSPVAMFDDAVVPSGAALLSRLAADRLSALAR